MLMGCYDCRNLFFAHASTPGHLSWTPWKFIWRGECSAQDGSSAKGIIQKWQRGAWPAAKFACGEECALCHFNP